MIILEYHPVIIHMSVTSDGFKSIRYPHRRYIVTNTTSFCGSTYYMILRFCTLSVVKNIRTHDFVMERFVEELSRHFQSCQNAHTRWMPNLAWQVRDFLKFEIISLLLIIDGD